MNFKFEEDFENNLLLVHVDIPTRKKLNEARKKVILRDVLKLVEENYTSPPTHVLGGCISNISMKLDNRTIDCSGTWKFMLTPKVKKSVKKVVTTKKRSRKK